MHLLSKLIRHNAFIILIIAAVLVGFGISYSSGVFTNLKKDQGGLSVEGSQSLKASHYIKDNFGGENKQIIVVAKSNNLKVEDKNYKTNFEKALEPFKKEGATITSFYTTGANELKTKDSHSTYALVEMSNKTENDTYALIKKQPEKVGSLTIKYGGSLVASRQISHQIEQDLVKAEVFSLPILLILLIIIFRSFIAAVLPVLLGVIAIIGGTSVVRFIAHFIDIDQYAINIITVLGLGLSIDYSLLMVSRFREELQKNNKYIAIENTIRSSGRTILFSGLTVMICLSGLTFFPVSFLRSVGIGGVAALAVTLVAALTVLPSLLVLIGENINKGLISRKKQKQHFNKQKSHWRTLGMAITNYPISSLVFAAIIILVAALPLVHVKIKSSGLDYRGLPRGSTSREVAQTLSQNFGSKTPTLQVVYYHNGKINGSQGIEDVYNLTQYISSLKGVTKVEGLAGGKEASLAVYKALYGLTDHPPQLAPLEKQLLHKNSTYIKVYTSGDSSSKETQELVKQIRSYKPENGSILTDGSAAVEYDIRASVAERAPIAFGIVMLAILILLTLLLRSVIIPLQALFINSFSLLAAFGILVWIFQQGNLTNIGWFLQTGSLDLTILILIFTITLGLSMDYATFYYSRAREEYDKTSSTQTAILNGLVLTGPVITQAAILLFVVVIAFSTSNLAFLQQIGIGLALAVLVDAFIVRIIMVPAVMKITGKANWYAPRFIKNMEIPHE